MMTRICTAVIVAVALLSAVGFAQQGGRKVTGVVENARGLPVVNAAVSYAEAGLEVETTRTDEKGEFEIPNGTRGIVTVSAQGFGTAKRSWPPRTGRELLFALTLPAVVTGSLVDAATGRAIEGRVSLLMRSRFHHVSKSTRTRGEFAFVDLPEGPGIIQAYADGFAPHFSVLRMVYAAERVETQIALLLEAVAVGSVLAADDSAAEGATVYVGYARSLAGAEQLARLAGGHMVTNEEGQFRITGLVPDNPIALQAELNGRLSDVVTVEIDPGTEQQNIVLRMQ